MAIAAFVSRLLEKYLTAPAGGPHAVPTCDPGQLARTLRPGDVLLVDGRSRVAGVIKFLTHSTWSHAALYKGPLAGRTTADGEPHVFVEAELGEGVVSSPFSKYINAHTRICRPVGLSQEDIGKLIKYASGRIGHEYDTRNVLDLMRYLLPRPPVPARYHRKMIALGSGSPTRAICSTLIAQAFESVNYPVLPVIECLHEMPGGHVTGDDLLANQARQKEILEIRHHSLYTPSDFDVSPYFANISPAIECGFDYREVTWKQARQAADSAAPQ